ncbi:5-formyltetrahydrofolate cyclo-ligase [Hankyongella ginsenosidimutans]|uniref:5-formyltetrahydrofolate cyclo-ligase n=1 Tax=Hankyongella ginsenosidimutans TaxID=1763828 RepID=UPI00248300F8|nr:5-formyltetrahydrofolate cyclo-ligase [Hankyongella ginsenosidimutans]
MPPSPGGAGASPCPASAARRWFSRLARHRLCTAPGFQGIPEPDARLPAVVPDVLLVPLLAATLAGGRLGQGKGFYDRTLATTPAFAVGLLYVVQLVEALPLDPWDRALAALATPDRWIVP